MLVAGPTAQRTGSITSDFRWAPKQGNPPATPAKGLGRANTRSRPHRGKLTMGRFDNRETQKMTRRKQQRKKKARLARRADAARAERTKKKPASKKRGASASAS